MTIPTRGFAFWKKLLHGMWTSCGTAVEKEWPRRRTSSPWMPVIQAAFARLCPVGFPWDRYDSSLFWEAQWGAPNAAPPFIDPRFQIRLNAAPALLPIFFAIKASNAILFKSLFPWNKQHNLKLFQDRLWRKNRPTTTRSYCQGVDLNRNFGYFWGGNKIVANI